jgi:hypothetical protein
MLLTSFDSAIIFLYSLSSNLKVYVEKARLNSNPLSTRLAGLELRNPTALASGILSYSPESLLQTGALKDSLKTLLITYFKIRKRQCVRSRRVGNAFRQRTIREVFS